jgi:hypothetical protein
MRTSVVELSAESLSKGMKRAGAVALVAIGAACSAAAPGDPIGTSGQSVTGTCATPVVVDRSLFVALEDTTGASNPFAKAALANFTLQDVMDQIITTGATGSTQTALELYDQMLDTLNKAPGDTDGPHCTGTINGFAVECPSPEGSIAATNPFTGSVGAMTPVAVVNRFDLAPSNGANCGEYRVVFGMSDPPSGVERFLMIFEAALPNPVPSQGIAACLPVAQFWDNLSSTTLTKAEFTKQLKTFYFDGIPGLPGNPAFGPVISAFNYGIGGPKNTNTGQIRANMLDNFGIWQLREFTLSQGCTDGVCTLTANNTFVKNNPFGELFLSGGNETFQTEFIKQVKTLASDSVPLISMKTPNVDNAGESPESVDTNDYACQAGLGSAAFDTCTGNTANTLLSNAIQAELTTLGSSLTPLDILQRATTQSCAGCHELSQGVALGGGLFWPFSENFTQVNEQGGQSPALTGTFLPFRSTVLTTFIDAHCGASDAGSGEAGTPEDNGLTIGGQAVGASN